MKKLLFLAVIFSLIGLFEYSTVDAATTVTKIFNGGTGTTTAPVSQVLYGGATAYQSVATTTLSGTGVITITNSPVLLGASPAVASLTGGSNGQVLGWSGGAPTWVATTTAGTGLSYNGTSFTVNTSQNISALSNLTSNGFVKTSGGTGALSIDTTSYTPTTRSLTVAGTANQITSSAAGQDLSADRTWTLSIPSQFNIQKASTTDFSANTLAVGGTATTTLGSDGKITGNDVANSWLGRITPTARFALQTGTTTTWTASTTGTAYSPFITMPYTGTLRSVYCNTDASFLGVNVKVNGSSAAPSYFVASTTPGTVPFTGSNTFTKGQKVLMDVGTTTTATALSISCTFDVTETP